MLLLLPCATHPPPALPFKPQPIFSQYERRDKFDRVVIETTGLANPAPVIQTFFLEPSVADRMKLDGVVTLVDAKHVELHLDEEKPKGIVNEAMEQIAYADRILLNKTDLVRAACLVGGELYHLLWWIIWLHAEVSPLHGHAGQHQR